MKAIVTDVHAFARVVIKDVEPYQESRVILSSYDRVASLFQPQVIEVAVELFRNEARWPTATVRGKAEGTRRPGQLTRHATLKLSGDENGRVDHWPAYARAALAKVQKAVKL